MASLEKVRHFMLLHLILPFAFRKKEKVMKGFVSLFMASFLTLFGQDKPEASFPCKSRFVSSVSLTSSREKDRCQTVRGGSEGSTNALKSLDFVRIVMWVWRKRVLFSLPLLICTFLSFLLFCPLTSVQCTNSCLLPYSCLYTQALARRIVTNSCY